jgi:penicillin-binding protein 2
MLRLRFLTLIIFLAASSGYCQKMDAFHPDAKTDADVTPYLFSIPAPRGQILDRMGRALARTVVKYKLTLSLPQEKDESLEMFTAAVRERLLVAQKGLSGVVIFPEDADLKSYFAHRRRLPLAVSSLLDPDKDVAVLKKAEMLGFGKRGIYVREYPNGQTAAHVLGHLGLTGTPLRGPVQQREFFWQDNEGKSGVEYTYDEWLRGTTGLMIQGYDKDAQKAGRDLIAAPLPGADLILTLDLKIQQAVEEAMTEADRPGAVVVMNAYNGDILAMASFPTFDPNAFVPRISHTEYSALSSDGRSPLFNRAACAAYPPGSVFKPIVALASLDSGAVAAGDYYECGPKLVIAGREFKNWSDSDQGLFSLRGALIRSCNTYFYQSAIDTGFDPIMRVAWELGLATKPDIRLPGIATGSLPTSVPSLHGLVNLSIGQGDVLASPLQMASVMTAFASRIERPKPKLVSQIQTQSGEMLRQFAAMVKSLNYHEHDMRYVRSGMYGVVNHVSGTAKSARMDYVPVCGKTGTAQWSNKGKMTNVVWFTGFVGNSSPPIAFAVALEGQPGERIFGGSTAAPVASKFLAKMFDENGGCNVHRAARTTPYPLETYTIIQPVIAIAQPVPAAAPSNNRTHETEQKSRWRRWFSR